MAAIDHTIIGFKNGKLLENLYFIKCEEKQAVFEDTGETYTAFETVAEKNFIPFDYNRDGLITNRKQRLEEWMEVYNEDCNYDPAKHSKKWKKYCDKLRNKYFKHIKNPYKYDCPEEYKIRYYYKKDDDVEIIAVYNEIQDYCVTFYFTEEDSYVLLGGYGHHSNPFLHFYERGYGRQFERKMAKDCYKWLCEDVLEEAMKNIPGLTTDKYNDNVDEDDYHKLLKKLNHMHWLDKPKNYKDKSLIELDPEATDKKRKEFED